MGAILADLEPRLAALAVKAGGPLHFVTHSLGGIVARGVIATGKVPVGRVVMLGPPNAGSEWADLLFRLRLDRLVLGGSGSVLRTLRTDADAALLSGRTHDIGIIAGTRALNPLFPRLLLTGANDGKVTVAATMLPGAAHFTLPVSHTLMVYDREVARQTVAFLNSGRFAVRSLDSAGAR